MGVEDGFGAVTVVGVEIPNGDAAGTEMVVGVEGGDGDGVEIAEAHGSGGGGVMAGWAHEGESGRAPGERVGGGGESGGHGATSVGGDVVKERRVSVKVAGFVEAAQVGGGMSEQQGRVGD